MHRTVGAVVGAIVGMTLVSMLIVGSFLGALHQPKPHHLPVAVVGPPAATRTIATALDQHAPGAIDIRAYDRPDTARAAILDRDVDAALIVQPGHPQLLVAGASGRFVTQAVTGVFQAQAAATGQQLTVQDVRPLPPGDENGISPLFTVVAVALPGIAFGIVLSVALGRTLPVAGRWAALLGFSVVLGLAVAWVADGLVGALPGAVGGLIGVLTLTAFAIAATTAAATRLAGPALGVLAALLLVPVGIPASGGPFGRVFVTPWYGDLGAALPTGAAMTALRDVVSFDGRALGTPLLVLALWAAVAAAIVALPRLRREHGEAPQAVAA